MESKKIKIKCQYCNKLFMEKPIKNCVNHYCGECVYLWILTSITDLIPQPHTAHALSIF